MNRNANRHYAKARSEVSLPDAKGGAKRAAARAQRRMARAEIEAALAEEGEAA